MRHRFTWILGLLLLLSQGRAQAAPISLEEGFDDIGALAAAGWEMVNNSSPLGVTGWFQGNAGVFTSESGSPDSYVAANYLNAGDGGDISNWLLSPVLTVADGTILRFYTQTAGGGYADRLEVRFSSNGASSDVGAFTTLLLTVNPLLDADGYPTAWTAYEVALSGLGGTVDGRFGFHYNVTDTSLNANYIGIDTVSVVEAVPEPGTAAVLGMGLLGLALLARARRRS